MTLSAWAAFIVAGAAGALSRYTLEGVVQERLGTRFPAGTLAVNLSGCFALGLIASAAVHHGLSRTGTLVAGTAFCGAYTTFSSFAFETVRFHDESLRRAALVNTFVTLAGGAVAAAAGLALGAR